MSDKTQNLKKTVKIILIMLILVLLSLFWACDAFTTGELCPSCSAPAIKFQFRDASTGEMVIFLIEVANKKALQKQGDNKPFIIKENFSGGDC